MWPRLLSKLKVRTRAEESQSNTTDSQTHRTDPEATPRWGGPHEQTEVSLVCVSVKSKRCFGKPERQNFKATNTAAAAFLGTKQQPRVATGSEVHIHTRHREHVGFVSPLKAGVSPRPCSLTGSALASWSSAQASCFPVIRHSKLELLLEKQRDTHATLPRHLVSMTPGTALWLSRYWNDE